MDIVLSRSFFLICPSGTSHIGIIPLCFGHISQFD